MRPPAVQIVGVPALGVHRVCRDDRSEQRNGVQQRGEHGDLVRFRFDVDLAEDDTVGVVESGQQMPPRLITPGGAAQRLAVDRDDPLHIGNRLAAGQRPLAKAVVERLGVQRLQHPAERRLARHRLPDPEPRQRGAVGVGGPFRDRDERAGPGQHRAQRQPQHRGELMADPATSAGVTDRVQDSQRVRQVIAERRADSLQLVDDRADR